MSEIFIKFNNSKISEHAQMSKMFSVFEHTRKSKIFDESLDKFAIADPINHFKGDF